MFERHHLKKTLLILSGGKEAIEGIKIAKNMGLQIIVCDGNEHAPGRLLADEFLLGNIYDVKEMVKVISEYRYKDKIDGVITIASDAVKSVSAISSHLNLPGISKKTAQLSTEKFQMKKCFQQNSIPIPKFTDITSESELKKKVRDDFGKSILKPVDSRGSRGVVRINENTDLKWAFNYSMQFSQSKKLILEEWLTGPQLSTESLVVHDKTYLCGVADRNYSNAKNTFPYVIEDGGETPSKFSPKINERLTRLLDRAVVAVGLENGVIKGDIVLKNGIPYIIEIAARLSGGFFSTLTIPLVYRINIVEKAIRIALGINVELPPLNLKHYCYQANRFFFARPGIVKRISKPTAKQIPEYVKFFELNAKVGDKIENIANHTMRKGSVMVIRKTRKQSITSVLNFVKKVKIDTK